MSHEHPALIRPKTPFRPVDGSIWWPTLVFPFINFIGQLNLNICYRCLFLKGFFETSVRHNY